jgi:hypothetical protein
MGATATEEFDDQAPMDGGAPGIVPQPTAQVTFPGTIARRDPDAPPAPPVDRYRVVGHYDIIYSGCKTHLKDGKTVDEYTYDLDLLRRQGVRLEKIG